jgi:hypothetical protein
LAAGVGGVGGLGDVDGARSRRGRGRRRGLVPDWGSGRRRGLVPDWGAGEGWFPAGVRGAGGGWFLTGAPAEAGSRPGTPLPPERPDRSKAPATARALVRLGCYTAHSLTHPIPVRELWSVWVVDAGAPPVDAGQDATLDATSVRPQQNARIATDTAASRLWPRGRQRQPRAGGRRRPWSPETAREQAADFAPSVCACAALGPLTRGSGTAPWAPGLRRRCCVVAPRSSLRTRERCRRRGSGSWSAPGW